MKIFLTLVAIVAVLSGVVAYSLFWGTSKNPDTEMTKDMATNEVAVADSESEDFSGTGTLKDLYLRNSSLECAVTYAPNEFDPEVTGTYFIADGKIRGDFVTISPELGGEIVTSVIVADDTTYVWSDINGSLFGVKSKIDTTTNTNVPVPDDVAVRYSCTPWTQVDGSIFVAPSTVLFKDSQELLDVGMEYGTIYEEE